MTGTETDKHGRIYEVFGTAIDARHLALRFLKLQRQPEEMTQEVAVSSLQYSSYFLIFWILYRAISESNEFQVVPELLCSMLQLYITQHVSTGGIAAAISVRERKNTSLLFHAVTCGYLLLVNYVYVIAGTPASTVSIMNDEVNHKEECVLAVITRYMFHILLKGVVGFVLLSVYKLYSKMRGLQAVYLPCVCVAVLLQYWMIGKHISDSFEQHQCRIGGSVLFLVFSLAVGLYICADVLDVLITLKNGIEKKKQQPYGVNADVTFTGVMSTKIRMASYVLGCLDAIPYLCVFFYTAPHRGLNVLMVFFAHVSPLLIAIETYKFLSSLEYRDAEHAMVYFGVPSPGEQRLLGFAVLATSSWVSAYIITTITFGLCAIYVQFMYHASVEDIVPGTSAIPLIPVFLLSLAAGTFLAASLVIRNVPSDGMPALQWNSSIPHIMAIALILHCAWMLPFAPFSKVPLISAAETTQAEIGESVTMGYAPDIFRLKSVAVQSGPLGWAVTNGMFIPMLFLGVSMAVRISERLRILDHWMSAVHECFLFWVAMRAWYRSYVFLAAHLLGYWNERQTLGAALLVLAVVMAFTTLLSWMVDIADLYCGGSMSYEDCQRIYRSACAGETKPYYRPRTSLMIVAGSLFLAGVAFSAMSSYIWMRFLQAFLFVLALHYAAKTVRPLWCLCAASVFILYYVQ